MKLFSVFDEKASYYAAPFVAKTISEASRMFADAVNDPKTLFAMHPSDFTLYLLGECDDISGVLRGDKPMFVAKGSEFVVKVVE